MTMAVTNRGEFELVEHDPNRYGVAFSPLVLQFGERERPEKFAMLQAIFQGVDQATLAKAILLTK